MGMLLNPETATNADGIILSNVTRLGLGTAQFGMRYGIANRTGQVGHDEGAAMLRYAGEVGIRLIDTAMAYGESEACLGQLGVSTIQVVTKLGNVPAGMSPALVRDFVRKSVAGSLARLQIPRLYALLLHRPEQLSGPLSASLVQALLKLKLLHAPVWVVRDET